MLLGSYRLKSSLLLLYFQGNKKGVGFWLSCLSSSPLYSTTGMIFPAVLTNSTAVQQFMFVSGVSLTNAKVTAVAKVTKDKKALSVASTLGSSCQRSVSVWLPGRHLVRTIHREFFPCLCIPLQWSLVDDNRQWFCWQATEVQSRFNTSSLKD